MIMYHPIPAPRRRLWPIFLPVGLLVLLALAWSGFWYFAAAQTETAIAGWREREAKLGRISSCGSQRIGGYPFRIEIHCADPAAELRNLQPPMALEGKNILIAAQLYNPTLLISEFTGPVTFAQPGRAPDYVANWSLAQTSVRGTPSAPERASIVLETASFERVNGNRNDTLASAKRLELHGRLAGSVADHPILELALRLVAATAPGLHAVAGEPLDADFTVVLRGLNDFSPKPWPVRFRELQAAGGQIEIKNARLQQGESLTVGSGALGLSPSGRLEGQIQLTIAGLEQLWPRLGIERVAPQMAPHMRGFERFGPALDMFAPGLGNMARRQAEAGIAAGLGMLGEQTQLEGRRAVAIPLRFSNGAAFLGPVPLGQVPPLF
jgi:hypothetical protein